MQNDVDQIAIVVDWLDACRRRDLAALLDMYAPDAIVECRCNQATSFEGRTQLASYWRPRLDAACALAFGLEEITPTPEGVLLDYISYEGKPVQVSFVFSTTGAILQTQCWPSKRAFDREVCGS